MRAPLRPVVTALLGLALTCVAPTSHAEPPAPELLARLAAYAARFERMRTSATYAVESHVERLDGDGKTDSVKDTWGRVVSDGARVHFEVLRCVEDGADKTDEAREKAASGDKKKERLEIRIPFLAGEQGRYTFDQLEADRADPARVRMTFVPKTPAEDTIEGSVWVDTRTGTPVSAGFKVSRTSSFVDYVHLTVEFGEMTPFGPAISRVTLDGKGGVLFFRKHIKLRATMSGYHLSP